MSSKDSILASIRRHTGARHEMPELTLEAITYASYKQRASMGAAYR